MYIGLQEDVSLGDLVKKIVENLERYCLLKPKDLYKKDYRLLIDKFRNHDVFGKVRVQKGFPHEHNFFHTIFLHLC